MTRLALALWALVSLAWIGLVAFALLAPCASVHGTIWCPFPGDTDLDGALASHLALVAICGLLPPLVLLGLGALLRFFIREIRHG